MPKSAAFATTSYATDADRVDEVVQSWYPLARARDIPRGKTVAVTLFDHQLIVFKTRENRFAVLKRQCCHMGGDLVRGRVTDSGIRCPIHQWEFAYDGTRQDHDASITDLAPACQPALHCEERFGIVFAFFGPKVLFDIPTPADAVFRSPVTLRDFDANYTVPTVFGFDSDHFATVHHRALETLDIYSDSPHHLGTHIEAAVAGDNISDRLMRMIGLDSVETDIDFWGANMMLGRHKRSGTFAFIATLPLAENRSKIFVVVMQQKPNGNALRRWLGWLRFKLSQRVMLNFVKQDERALNGVRFDPRSKHLIGNEGIKRWLQHYRCLPTILTRRLFDEG